VATPSATPNYASIDDVSEPALREVVCRTLHAFGATPEGELIQAVARQLGFKRTGNRIQARIEACLEALIGVGQVCRTTDQRLQAAPASRAASM
jgi:hypothetical protein